jgi:hypothetical protein
MRLHRPQHEEKLDFVLENNLVPFLHGNSSNSKPIVDAKERKPDTISITADIRQEARRLGVEPIPSSLEDIAHLMGLEYGFQWSGRRSGRVAYGQKDKLVKFLKMEEDDKENAGAGGQATLDKKKH